MENYKKEEKSDQPICIGLIDDKPDKALQIQQEFEKNSIVADIRLYQNVKEASEYIRETGKLDGIILTNQHLPNISDLFPMLNTQRPTLLLIPPGNERLAADAIKAGVDYYLIMDTENVYLELLPLIFMRIIRRKKDCLIRKQMEKALRESEEKYRSMMEAISDPMYICSSDFRITYMNPAMIKRTGKNATGEFCYQVVHHCEEKCPWCFYEKISNGTSYEIEINNPKDGRFYHISNSPIFHENGSVSKMTMLRDITEKKEQESVIRKAKDAAEAANRVKSEFLANMSHEIRTPMNSVIGMIELALNTSLDDRQKDFLETARISADSLLELLNDILELSEMNINPNLKPDENDIEVRCFMDSIVKSLSQRARQKNLRMTVSLSPDVPSFVKTDARRVRQILNNLIRNAIKFTEKGKIGIFCDIDVGSKVPLHKDKEKPETDVSEFHLLFGVSDTGIGIAPDRIEHVFESFTQADSSHTRRFGGTGVGITLSKYLTRMMGGKIWVKSELGKGSTFCFTIRTRLGKAVRTSEPDLLKPSEKPERKLRILLAEDNPLNQKLALSILNMRNHQIEVVGNGRAALELLEKEKFDLILMDVQMPEMDGLEATRHIREKEMQTGGHIPIVAITAHAMKQDQEQCMTAGMDAYISKPIRHDQFLATIESLIPSETTPHSHAEEKEPQTKTVCQPVLTEASDKEIFDKDALSEIVGGSMELVAELVRLYMSNLPNLLTAIEEAIKEEDSKQLEFNAHSLKGMSLNLSAKRVAKVSLELEKLGRNCDLSQAPEIFATLRQETEKLEWVLNKIQAG